MTIPVSGSVSIELLEERHAAGLLNAVDSSRSHLRVWLPWVDNMQTIEQLKRHIDAARLRSKVGSEFPGVIIENNQIIGRMGLYQIDTFNQNATIGYWIGSHHQGRGIITMAAEAIVRHAFTEIGLHRLEIRCAVGNIRSEAIPKRLGFVYEGTLRQCEALHGGFVDHKVYSLLKPDWASRNSSRS